MVDVSIANKTSPEANWNRRADRQTDKPMCWEAADRKTKRVEFKNIEKFKVAKNRVYNFLLLIS